ncbi:MAG: peptidoglycan-binding domain-containing protein [Candidatus Staskawiczbacteria bacterium]|jgi:hypothetical protein
MFENKTKTLEFILVSAFFMLALAGTVNAQTGAVNFFVESNFDVSGRSKIEAVSIKTSSNVYFYIEKSWWDAQYQLKKDEILKNIDDLSVEFENNIYPNLTNVFGNERKPGIDGDNKITVLFHPMKGSEIGYFRTNDGYEKLQVSTSNEKEMVYMSADLLTSPKLKIALAHEFVHLITFNQKNIAFNVEEDTWLNEARADYSSTILGYDNQFEMSNLQSRIKDFVESSSDSITEWRGSKYDYASVSLFVHYLVDHYGIKILSDSLRFKYVGIESINYALEKNGYKEKFSEIFTNWTIALALNNCSLGPKYCYLDKNLNDIRVAPNINFLPSGNVSLSFINTAKDWSINWQKFIGGSGDLKVEFLIKNSLKFTVPYIIEDKQEEHTIKFLTFNNSGIGTFSIPNFSTYYKSLIIIPVLQTSSLGVDGTGPVYSYNYIISSNKRDLVADQILMQQLLAQIESLKKQIADIIAQRAGGGTTQTNACQITKNLSYGMSNSSDVRCLQTFLKNQSGIFYSGLVSGYFGPLTKASVIKFQQKYVLSATGVVDEQTRIKINQILNAG